MLTLAKICEALLPLGYSAAFAVYAMAFFRRDSGFDHWRRPALAGVLALHTLLIYARTSYHGHCLVYTPFEIMTLLSFTITLTYLVVEVMSGERGTGMFFLGLALVLQTLSSMFAAGIEVASVDPSLLKVEVGLHISAAIFGYTAFAMSAVFGVLYLLLYRKIKSNSFGPFFQRLPSLQLLERLSEKSAVIGVIFLAASIIIGVLYLPHFLDNVSYGDPKLITTFLVWITYVVALGAKYTGQLDSRAVVILSLVGFAGTILSMTLLNLVMGGFHQFQP